MIKIRAAGIEDAKAIAHIQISSWRKAYKGIVPDRYLDEMHTETHIQKWEGFLADTDPDVDFFVPVVDGVVTGFINTGPARDEKAGFMAELRSLYLHPTYWGQGIGAQLFEHSRKSLKAKGVENLYVWVLKDNPIGRRFYEKAGGIKIKGLSKMTVIDDLELEEIVYGWPAL